MPGSDRGTMPTLQQGPKAGRHWPAEATTYEDPETGTTVHRLTDYPGSDNRHLYFTEDGHFDDGRRLLFRSDRSGTRQLYSIDLASGLITQVTDIEGFGGGTAVDHDANLVYAWVRDRDGDGRQTRPDRLVRLSLDTLRVEDTLYEVPEGYSGGSMDVNADGSRVYLALGEAVDAPDSDDKLTGMFEAAPSTRILSVPTDGGEAETLREVDVWASSHVNASPTRPELFTYCEEGPWDRVENRIWTVNAETGETWQVREVSPEGGVGHEYWLRDGERVGYHGSASDPQGRERVDDPDPFAGSARYDDTDHRETSLPDEVYALTHTHANTTDRVVCDGTFERIPYGLLYQWNDERGAYDGPRILATYDWTHQGPHPHSRFSPDGEHVLFDSARYDGSSNLYLVEVPDFADLPRYRPRT